MNEQKEKEIKTKLINFIRENFVFEGEPEKVNVLLYDKTQMLYQLVLEIIGVDKKDNSGLGGLTKM